MRPTNLTAYHLKCWQLAHFDPSPHMTTPCMACCAKYVGGPSNIYWENMQKNNMQHKECLYAGEFKGPVLLYNDPNGTADYRKFESVQELMDHLGPNYTAYMSDPSPDSPNDQ